jgi:hypothetical protein
VWEQAHDMFREKVKNHKPIIIDAGDEDNKDGEADSA